MEKWWERTGAFVRLISKKWHMNLEDFAKLIPKLKEMGFGAIELYAPYMSGEEYLGLDIVDFMRVDPALGDMAGLKSFLRQAHEAGMYVIANVNVGYGARDYAPFLKACDDVKNGMDSVEREWFLFSERPAAMQRPNAPFFLQDADGKWIYSERAGQYFWVKWFGMKGDTVLPQFNFASASYQQACARGLSLWRDAGFDGFMVDAVNWYVNCDWEINERAITGPIHAKGERFAQPEGAGGFRDDPVPWIERGGYNCVQDYALNLWWEQVDVIGEAIRRECPQGIEAALESYRDRVVRAGGVCYTGINQADEAPLPLDAAQMLNLAVLVAAGEVVCINMMPWMFESQALRQLLHMQRAHPALSPVSARQCLAVQDEAHHMAWYKTCPGSGDAVLAVFNFENRPARVEARLPDGETIARELPAYGYWFEPRGRPGPD